VCATSTSKANSSTCIFYLLLLLVSRVRTCVALLVLFCSGCHILCFGRFVWFLFDNGY
jgi:hypothetical protein